MVQARTQEEFQKRVFGNGEMLSKEIDISPKNKKAEDNSFVILYRGKLTESTVNRLKKTVMKFSLDLENAKEVYLGFPPKEKNGSPTFVLLGKVDFSLHFYKEIKSIFLPFSQDTGYFMYSNGGLSTFNPDDFIDTIIFENPSTKELYI